MQINKMVLGSLATNCYIVCKDSTAIVVDPGADAERIYAKLSELGVTAQAVLLTHGHVDHIMAADSIRKKYGCRIYAGEKEKELLHDTEQNLTEMFTKPYTLDADCYVKDGQMLTIGDLVFQVLYTPGHTIGGVCYYVPEYQVVFCGDTIFQESVGRTDFPTGDSGALGKAVREKLYTLPDDTKLLPGHGVQTSVGHEKKYNPFVTGQ